MKSNNSSVRYVKKKKKENGAWCGIMSYNCVISIKEYSGKQSQTLLNYEVWS